MKCLEHLLKYMGQIGRTLNIRYNTKNKLTPAETTTAFPDIQTTNTEHTYGIITYTMDVIRRGRRGRHLNILEKYRI